MGAGFDRALLSEVEGRSMNELANKSRRINNEWASSMTPTFVDAERPGLVFFTLAIKREIAATIT